ncbi:TPA: DUF883 family protein [Escherichia coli]|nr:DUF883 family protein [Escherichia coli]HDY2306523.1 DUF883 family protein [Escherichia coli]
MFEKIENKAKGFAGEVQGKYGELTDDYGTQIKSTASKITAQRERAVQETADAVRNNVEKNPLAAISVAAGVGLLVGLLIGRK